MRHSIDPITNVATVSDLLESCDLMDLITQIEEANLDFDQRYPRRLFSSKNHQDLWLQYFHQPLKKIFGDYSLQQIFLTYELPGSHFSYHRSHPAIAHVAIFSLDHWIGASLRVLHDPACDLNYAGPDSFHRQGYRGDQFSDYAFHTNEMLVINNRPESRVWGFSTHVPPNSFKRSIWIYLS